MRRQNMLHLLKKSLKINMLMIKNIAKLEISHYTVKYRSAARSTCILKYSTLTEIHLVFHNGSNCNYHFIIKEIQSFS